MTRTVKTKFRSLVNIVRNLILMLAFNTVYLVRNYYEISVVIKQLNLDFNKQILKLIKEQYKEYYLPFCFLTIQKIVSHIKLYRNLLENTTQ